MTFTANTRDTGNSTAADYIAQMVQEAEEAQSLITQIEAAAQADAPVQAIIAEIEALAGIPFISQDQIAQIAAPYLALDAQYQAVIKADEAQLNTLGAGYSGMEDAINGLLAGIYTAGSHWDGNLDQDITNACSYIQQICAAMKDQATVDLLFAKMNQDGNDNVALLKDSIAMMQATSGEATQLISFQQTLSQQLVNLTNQYNAAKSDYDSYSWMDGMTYFCGSERDHMNDDKAIMRNCDDMRAMIYNVMGDIGPVIASLQSQVFAVAALSMTNILKQIVGIIFDPNMTTQQKGDAIKVLMALALGILSIVESDAAQLKAENEKTMSSAMTYAVQMNISDEKEQYDELQSQLKHAAQMKTIMSIAKPLIEVGGMLLAPGVLSFILMLALTIVDNVKVGTDKDGNDVTAMDKLTTVVAEAFHSQAGAEAFIAGIEILATLGAGGGMNAVAKEAAEEITANVAKEMTQVTTKLVDQGVQAAVTAAANAGKTLAPAELAAVRATVQKTVDEAVQKAITKTVQQFLKQAGAKLIPELIATGVKEQTASMATMIAKAAEPTALAAGKEAAEIAVSDVKFLAEAAAMGAKIAPEEVSTVSSRAANEAVARITSSTPKDVAEATEQSTARKVFTNVASISLYNAATNGNITELVTWLIKTLKDSKELDDASIQKLLEAIKIIESVIAAFALAWGTGMMQTTILDNSALSTALLKLGALAQMTGTGLSAISNAGQADAEMKEAPLVKSINELSVSNEMLQFLLDQLNKERKVESDHFLQVQQEHSSDYTTISHLEDSGKQLAQIMSQQAV